MTDPIADLLIRVKNAALAAREEVILPYSKMKESLAEILRAEGYLEKVTVLTEDNKKNLQLLLKKKGSLEVKRISKPGRRVYVQAKKIPTIHRGLGLTILSTPTGLMTHKTALKKNQGGEVLCKII